MNDSSPLGSLKTPQPVRRVKWTWAHWERTVIHVRVMKLMHSWTGSSQMQPNHWCPGKKNCQSGNIFCMPVAIHHIPFSSQNATCTLNCQLAVYYSVNSADIQGPEGQFQELLGRKYELSQIDQGIPQTDCPDIYYVMN